MTYHQCSQILKKKIIMMDCNWILFIKKRLVLSEVIFTSQKKIVNIKYLCYRDVSYRLHCISVHRSYHLFSNKRNKYLDDIKQFLKKAGKSVGCFFHTTFSIMEDSIFSCIPKENYPLITRHWWPSHVKIYMYIYIREQ